MCPSRAGRKTWFGLYNRADKGDPRWRWEWVFLRFILDRYTGRCAACEGGQRCIGCTPGYAIIACGGRLRLQLSGIAWSGVTGWRRIART